MVAGWVDIMGDFFFQAEDGIRDHCVTGVQTCALPIYFSLRQRPHFFYCPFLIAAAPRFFCPIFVAGAPPLFILPIFRCGSTPVLYTAHFSLRQRPAFYNAHFLLRQRPRFLYCPVLFAAAPPLFIFTNSRCGSAAAF